MIANAGFTTCFILILNKLCLSDAFKITPTLNSCAHTGTADTAVKSELYTTVDDLIL